MWPFRRSPEVPTFEVENTIGAHTVIRGDVRGPGGFRIDGTVHGSVEADGPVVIGEAGLVEGGVRGRDVIVLGRVRGDVRASGHLEIGPEGAIVGDISVTSMRMHKGGVFRGVSLMDGADELAIGALPPAAESVERVESVAVAGEEPRTRTLPPPVGTGAVPPPPSLGELAPVAPPVPLSEERLIALDVLDKDRNDAANG